MLQKIFKFENQTNKIDLQINFLFYEWSVVQLSVYIMLQ